MKEVKRIYFDHTSGFPNIPIMETDEGELLYPYFWDGLIQWDSKSVVLERYKKWKEEQDKPKTFWQRLWS